jgi:hypothetical protein
MEIKSLRDKIHEMVDKIEDESALNILMEDAAIYSKTGTTGEEDNLTTEQWASIEEAREQIKNGQFKSYAAVKEHFAQWHTK